jgi:hypothetical protein
MTDIAAKAAGYDRANRFYEELIDATESFSDIIAVYGEPAFVDLMYLQHAIMEGNHIDHYPETSKIAEIIALLPSAAEWMKFVKDPEASPAP